MLSMHLVNLLHLSIDRCKYETVRPVVKFRNLTSFALDFMRPKDELTFISENCRTFQKIRFNEKHLVELLGITTRVYRIKLQDSQIAEFDNLEAMLDYCLREDLLKERDGFGCSVRCGLHIVWSSSGKLRNRKNFRERRNSIAKFSSNGLKFKQTLSKSCKSCRRYFRSLGSSKSRCRSQSFNICSYLRRPFLSGLSAVRSATLRLPRTEVVHAPAPTNEPKYLKA